MPDGSHHTKETIKAKPYHSSKKIDETWKPEIVGRDIGRYYLENKNNRWVKYGNWLAAPRDPSNFIGKRLLVQEITGGTDKRITATYYDKELYHSRDIIPVKIIGNKLHPYLLLAIINSHLITWFHHKRNPKSQKGLFPKILVSDLRRIPIPEINKNQEKEIVSAVDKMLKLNQNPSIREKEQAKIKALDYEINQLVYKLYGLNKDEIKIVER